MKKFKNKIRLLLADDHPVVREGIRSCLANHDRLEIVGEAIDGKDAINKAKELVPDIVLMDINMPTMNGLKATEELRQKLPKIKVLILTVHSNKEYALQMIRSGARGYVLKDSSPKELIQAIESVYHGDAFFSPEVARLVLNDYVAKASRIDSAPAAELSEREREVLALIAKGCTSKQIAAQLGVSIRTAESHRENIMRKLNIHNVAGLTRFAISKGIIVSD